MPFKDLVKIMADLRGPSGCPWDKEQTRETLKPFLAEELYELLDALDEDNAQNIKEELGDMLFQIIFHSRLSEERGEFDINDVVKEIVEKMIKRHPHVFGNKDLKTSHDVTHWWEENKRREKNHSSITDGIPRTLPALLKAQKLQDRVSRVGFDWDRIEDIFAKLYEELDELKRAMDGKDINEIEHELGDIFFVLVRISSFLNINSEDALRKTIRKFIRRFKYMEDKASGQERKISDMTLEEMEGIWQESKKNDV